MDAREYLDLLVDENAIIRLKHYAGDSCDGRGRAVIIDDEHQIAVMLEDCGFSEDSGVRAGDIVKFILHPEAEPKIVGSAATVRG